MSELWGEPSDIPNPAEVKNSLSQGLFARDGPGLLSPACRHHAAPCAFHIHFWLEHAK
jgi:hypothetical protein